MSNYLKWKKYENFIDWDIPNWSRAIQYLDKYKLTEFYGKKVLEIGSGFGCLSFWAASNGAKVICSDIVASSEVTINMVKKYKIKKILSLKN